jgi:hypothetical protein
VPNVAGCLGTGVHRAMKVLCETNDPETAARALDAYLRMPAHECAGPLQARTAFDLFERGSAAHIDSERRPPGGTRMGALPSRGVTVTARVDRVDWLADGHYQIIDWKRAATTTTIRPTPSR